MDDHSPVGLGLAKGIADAGARSPQLDKYALHQPPTSVILSSCLVLSCPWQRLVFVCSAARLASGFASAFAHANPLSETRVKTGF